MSDYFPEEIIHKILLKLPAKSLIKFTLVCKSWKSLIKSSAFIQSHLRTTIDSNDSHLLLLSACSYDRDYNRYQHHWLRWDSPDIGEHSMLPTPVIFLESKPVSDLGVIGTSNGLVCLKGFHFSCDPSPVFWNPSIRKVVMLPKPPGCFIYNRYDRYTMQAFGYDAHSNDYKILRVVTDFEDDHLGLLPEITTFAQVYSLARGSWKSLSPPVILLDFHPGPPAFVNGTFHRLEACFSQYYDDGDNGEDMVIRTFNLATEEFGKMMGPASLQRYRRDCSSISRYGDSLALIKPYDDEDSCDIWVMKQYGVAESWTKVFNIPVAQADLYGFFRRCGEIVLDERIDYAQSRLISYDPKSNQYLVLGVEGYSYYFMDCFVESLVLLDHCNAISYQVAKTE